MVEEALAANKVLPKLGLKGFDWTFLQDSIFVLRLNFSSKYPPSAIPYTLAASVKRPRHTYEF
jgi:hypothetical protein